VAPLVRAFRDAAAAFSATGVTKDMPQKSAIT
jgi:hypothetical protein